MIALEILLSSWDATDAISSRVRASFDYEPCATSRVPEKSNLLMRLLSSRGGHPPFKLVCGVIFDVPTFFSLNSNSEA